MKVILVNANAVAMVTAMSRLVQNTKTSLKRRSCFRFRKLRPLLTAPGHVTSKPSSRLEPGLLLSCCSAPPSTGDLCQVNRCSNGGTCVTGEGQRLICICPDGFDGETCNETESGERRGGASGEREQLTELMLLFFCRFSTQVRAAPTPARTTASARRRVRAAEETSSASTSASVLRALTASTARTVSSDQLGDIQVQGRSRRRRR